MVIRKRVRAVVIPLVLYTVSGAVVGYFVFHAHHGSRGLEAKRELTEEIAALTEELNGLKTERSTWERRVALLRADGIDRDVLEEEAREVLGYVHKNDVVIMLGSEKNAGAVPSSSATPSTSP